MTSKIDELVSWLREQMDDDQQVAEACQAGARGPWSFDDVVRDADGDEVAGLYRWGVESLPYEDGAHIARWDPVRVLAEVEAKRTRIDLLAAEWRHAAGDNTGDRVAYAVADLTEDLLKLEAQPFASRPGFRDEWRLT